MEMKILSGAGTTLMPCPNNDPHGQHLVWSGANTLKGVANYEIWF